MKVIEGGKEKKRRGGEGYTGVGGVGGGRAVGKRGEEERKGANRDM